MNYCSPRDSSKADGCWIGTRLAAVLLASAGIGTLFSVLECKAQAASDALPPPPTFQSGSGISPSTTAPSPTPRPFQGEGSRFPGVPFELPWMKNAKVNQQAQPLAPADSLSFFSGLKMNRVPIGTVLTGILESDLSSGESKPGDIFAIRLEEGYFSGTQEIIPRNSRIIGAVVSAVPAQAMTHGVPGNLKISLQMLVFPDGRNTPIFGHLDHNPNMDLLENPANSQVASQLSYYPRAAASSLAMVGRTISGRLIGIRPGIKSRGLDFKLTQGEVVAIKLNRSLDLNQLAPPSNSYIPPGMPLPPAPLMQLTRSSLREGSQPVGFQPFPQLPQQNSQPSGFQPFPQQESPAQGVQPAPQKASAPVGFQPFHQSKPAASNGGPPVAPSFKPQSTTGLSAPPMHPGEDPNKIFDMPVGHTPKLDMPEPF